MIANNIIFKTNHSINKRFFKKMFDSLKNVQYLYSDDN